MAIRKYISMLVGMTNILLAYPISSDAQGQGTIPIVCDTPPEEQMTVLQQFLDGGGFASAQYSQETVLPVLSAGAPRAVIVYVHQVLKEAVENALISYCLDGGNLIVLHHAIASAKMENRRWLPFAGINLSKDPDSRFPWKVEQGKFLMINLNPGHFITSDKIVYDLRVPYMSSNTPSDTALFDAFSLGETELLKEQMFIDGAQKTILFGYLVNDTRNGRVYSADRAGWYRKEGKGYLFYFVAGHNEADFKNRNFSQLILNCLLWDRRG